VATFPGVSEQAEFWHLVVEPAEQWRDNVTVVDQSRDWIERRVLEPRRRGEPLVLGGRTLGWDEIERVRISRSDVPSEAIVAQLRAEDAQSSVLIVGGPSYTERAAWGAEDKTNELIDAPPGLLVEMREAGRADDPRKVAVMHGRDAAARTAVFDFLRRVGLDPMEWDELVDLTGEAAPYNGQAVAAAFTTAQAVVVVLTPDDVGFLHPDLRGERELEDDRNPTGQARLNVVLEAGMALQSHPTRTVLVEIGHVRTISDLAGRNMVRLDGQAGSLNTLASRLERAGCPVQRTGADWLKAEAFARLDALTRRPPPAAAYDAPGDGGESADDEDDLTLEIKAAAERTDVALKDPQVNFFAEYLRTTSEPFNSSLLRQQLPPPTVPAGSTNRLLRDLHLHSGVVARAEGKAHGYVSTRARPS
jgi:predicted nucleotide-binding protein